ncbi:MAG: sulfurtransferase [Xanthomonadales bacterium]
MSKPKILLSAAQLNDGLNAGECIAVDCRFDLADTARGRSEWLAGHVPGARYAHLDDDLSSPIGPDTGRHPLPESAAFARYLASIGWRPDRLLVAYDESANAIAARLWWLMRYHGLPAALLDGGLAAWRAAGLPLEAGEPQVEPAPVPALSVDGEQVVTTARLARERPSFTVLDARTSDRFTGANEPLDTRAGHIPGALNRPFGHNLRLNGRFKDPEDLRDEFELLLDECPEPVVHSCGSGVTACHNLFAMELAGLGGSRLYAGSWSEWIRDVSRPVATGA